MGKWSTQALCLWFTKKLRCVTKINCFAFHRSTKPINSRDKWARILHSVFPQSCHPAPCIAQRGLGSWFPTLQNLHMSRYQRESLLPRLLATSLFLFCAFVRSGMITRAAAIFPIGRIHSQVFFIVATKPKHDFSPEKLNQTATVELHWWHTLVIERTVLIQC